MHKKNETIEIDIPQDDVDCWERYPKYHWVYDLSRLMDAQGIKWSPYKTDELNFSQSNMRLDSYRAIIQPGLIYIKNPDGDQLTSEIYIIKGEIKFMRHIDISGNELDSLIGQLELRLNAFVTLHFQKFTGVISVKTFGNDIYGIQLKPYSDPGLTTNQELVKLIRRIYKKTDITLSGLTDRVLHETLAS
jgi:hypothetical protein